VAPDPPSECQVIYEWSLTINSKPRLNWIEKVANGLFVKNLNITRVCTFSEIVKQKLESLDNLLKPDIYQIANRLLEFYSHELVCKTWQIIK